MEGRGERGRLTLLLQFRLPCLKEASDKLGAGVIEEPLQGLSGPLVLVELFGGPAHPRGGIWGWHPNSSLETHDLFSLKCSVKEAFGGVAGAQLAASGHLDLKGI